MSVSQLLTEAGPLIGDVAISESDDGNAWVVIFNEDTEVFIELDDEGSKVVLSANIATPDVNQRLTVYELILQVNSQYLQTGGLRFGLEEPEGNVEMIADLSLHELNATTLANVVADFASRIVEWRQTVHVGATETSTSDEITPSAHLIRV